MLQHVAVTGVPAVGKSTLIRRVLDELRRNYNISDFARGFYTEEVRGPQGRIGFDVVTLLGARCSLARVGPARKV